MDSTYYKRLKAAFTFFENYGFLFEVPADHSAIERIRRNASRVSFVFQDYSKVVKLSCVEYWTKIGGMTLSLQERSHTKKRSTADHAILL